MSITRRLMLVAAAATAILPLSSGRASSLPLPDSSRNAATRLRGLVSHPVSARRVGLVYLARFSREAGEAALTRLILSSLALREEGLERQDDRLLRAALASRVRSDFTEGLTAEIDGWILSRTEARLCALWV